MEQNWESLTQKFTEMIESASDLSSIESIRVELLGKKGQIASLMANMATISKEEKKNYGMAVNSLKQKTEKLLSEKIEQLKEKDMLEKIQQEKIDITLPASRVKYGTKHPLTIVREEIEDIFMKMGYSVYNGPEVELDFYNFERANIPADHPARDMQDTFYVDENRLLRTQTTAIQMRVLESQHDKLPIKVICPGKVYRNDDDDATHSHQFIQIEGLVVDENITMADLKGTLELLARSMFGKQREIRLRQSYFPFTEPSAEMDATCFVCEGKGCKVCKNSGWIEILGCGMVHPDVLRNCGIDPEVYSGFAFGFGVDRMVMLKYGIDDIRLLYESDMRFLNQF